MNKRNSNGSKKSAENRKIEDDTIITNQYDLINSVVDKRMKAYVMYESCEHQQTRLAFKKLEDLVKQRRASIHDIIHYSLIFILFILMVIGLKN